MTRYRPRLEGAELDEAADSWRPEWGQGMAPEEWRAAIREQVARSEGAMGVAALKDPSGIAACLKRYALTLQSPAGPLAGVGVGAVLTVPSRRGEGLARRLLSCLLEEAREEGVALALLYSDIGTSFYERLGFVTSNHVTWSCAVGALPSGAARPPLLQLGAEELCRRRRASYGPGWLAMRHSPRTWAYWSWRNQLAEGFAVGGGYVFVKAGAGGVLWVDDACGEAEQLWPTLRRLAEDRGLETVAGWLRPEHAGGPFVAQARSACIPMVAPLGSTIAPSTLVSWRAHFSSLDHF